MCSTSVTETLADLKDTAETSRPHEAVPGQVPVPESTAGGGTSARAVAEKSVDVLGQVPEENKVGCGEIEGAN